MLIVVPLLEQLNSFLSCRLCFMKTEFLFCLGLLLKNEHSNSSALFWLEAVMKYTFRYLWVVPLFWLCKILNCIWFVVSKVVLLFNLCYVIQFQFSSFLRSTSSNARFFKGATKLYFMPYLCVVIILFKTDLYKSKFPTYSFESLVFILLCSIFFACTVLNSVLSLQIIEKICLINVDITKCSVILFSLYINHM